MLRPHQLDADRAFVLIVDVQEKLLPLIRGREGIVRAARKLLDGAAVFQLPVLVTEQYPRGIGRTVEPLREVLQRKGVVRKEKSAFSAWAEASVRQAVLDVDRPQVILAGIETHVCVLQTALDLVSRDFEVFVCADAVGSRGSADHEVALACLRSEGVRVTTVESVLFELCGRCDGPRFKPMLDVIKAYPPAGDD